MAISSIVARSFTGSAAVFPIVTGTWHCVVALLLIIVGLMTDGEFLQVMHETILLPIRRPEPFALLAFGKVINVLDFPPNCDDSNADVFTSSFLFPAELWKASIKRGSYQDVVRGMSHMASAPWGRFAEIDGCHALKVPIVPLESSMRPDEFLEGGRCAYTHPFGHYSRRFFLFCDNAVDDASVGCSGCSRFYGGSALSEGVYRSTGPASIQGHFEVEKAKALMRSDWLLSLEPRFDAWMLAENADPKSFDFAGVV